MIAGLVTFACQHPTFVGIFVSAIALCVVVVGYIWLLDRNDSRSTSIPTIGSDVPAPLPRAHAKERE